MDPRRIRDTFEAIEAEARKVFIGQDEILSAVLVAILARGHVLLEGVPGLGKTLLVRTLGRVLGCHFRRVQFTPDLMPSDVTGSTLYNAQKGEFEFKHGPVFTNLLLADEVNRAPAKTQSAMLESMAERSVTVDGTTYPLPDPYFVLATQNPLESAGTYPLPEAQLDRFMFKVVIEHPSQAVEDDLLRQLRDGFDAADLDRVGLRAVIEPEELVRLREAIQAVRVDDAIIHYITSLVASSRAHRAVQIGASPRASIALFSVGRVEAAIQGRDFVVPDDVKLHGRAVLRHRLILQPDAEIEGVTPEQVVQAILQNTPVPNMRGGASTVGGGGRPRSGGGFDEDATWGPGVDPRGTGSSAPQPGFLDPAPAQASQPSQASFRDPTQAQRAPAERSVPRRAPAPSAPPRRAELLAQRQPTQRLDEPVQRQGAPLRRPPSRADSVRPESGPSHPAGLSPDRLPPAGAGPLAGPNPFKKS